LWRRGVGREGVLTGKSEFWRRRRRRTVSEGLGWNVM
jgi:hypothetical protein